MLYCRERKGGDSRERSIIIEEDDNVEEGGGFQTYLDNLSLCKKAKKKIADVNEV